jgi:MFS family permease
MAMMTFTTAANATMQLTVAPEMRGRVMGLYMFVFLGTNPLGAPLVGWMAEEFGPRMSIVIGGLVAMVAAATVIVIMVPLSSLMRHLRSLPAAMGLERA